MSSQNLPQNVIENVIKSLDDLVQATSVKSVLEHSQQITKILRLNECFGIQKFVKLNSILDMRVVSKWNRVASILKALERKLNLDVYEHRSKLTSRTALVIGGGIAGLRVAIELLLVGVKVIVVEKRDEFTRNNVIHLWPNVIHDMNSFGAKRFYSQFCVGPINHVSIRQIQLILLKIAIIYGVHFIPNVAFDELCPRLTEPREVECAGSGSCNCCCHVHSFGKGAYGHFSSQTNPIAAQELHSTAFDTIISCDGSREAFSRFFPRNELGKKLAIGLTVNFINHRTEEETQCSEISGVSKIYKQQWFKDLKETTGVDLENIVYYRDETHYFVMTASKQSLLTRGVLKQDFSLDQRDLLLDNDNINLKNLMKYSRDVAHYSTKLPYLDFASKASGGPDIQLFDFTSMYSAANASCAKKTYLKCCQPNIKLEPTSSTYSLLMLCGDSLLQPFWPTGSGAGRGFLSAMDAAWTAQMWFTEANPLNVDSMLCVIAKRELVYRLLAQTSPENIVLKNFTLDPMTRYNQLNLRDQKLLFDVKQQVRQLIVDTRDMNAKRYNENKRNRRATVGVDPDELKKAKKWQPEHSSSSYYAEKANQDKYQHALDVRRNNSFKNITNSNYLKPQEDNSVLEFKPRNSPEIQIRSLEQNKFVDHCPRNQSIPVSQDKKNYEAKNRVFEFEDFARPMFGQKQKESLKIKEDRKAPREVSPINLDAEIFPKECYSKNIQPLNDDSSSRNYATSKSKSFGTSRDFYQDFGFDDSEIEVLEAYENENDRKNALLYGNSRQKSVPKKHIIEKANDLKQLLDEFHKPMEPKLQNVGRFEDDDWNVKKWTSEDTFKTRLPDRQNLVHENSSELLQSRIDQYKRNNNFRHEMHLQKDHRPRTRELVNVRQDEIRQKFDKPAIKTDEPLLSVQMVRAQNSAGVHKDSSLSGTSGLLKSNPQSVGYTPRNIAQTAALAPNMKLGLGASAEAIARNCERCDEPVTALDGLNIGGNDYHKSCLNCAKCFFMLQPDELTSKSNDFLCKLCRRTKASALNSSGMMKMLLGDTSSTSGPSNPITSKPLKDPPTPALVSKSISLESPDNFSYAAPSMFTSTRSIEAKKNFLVNLEQIDLRSQEKSMHEEKHPAEVVEEIGKSLMSVSLIDPTFVERKRNGPIPTNSIETNDDEVGDIDDNQPENDTETDEENKKDDAAQDEEEEEDVGENFDDKQILERIHNKNIEVEQEFDDDIVLEQQIHADQEPKTVQMLSDSELSQSEAQEGPSNSTNFTDDERSESDNNAHHDEADAPQQFEGILNNITNSLSHAEIPLADEDELDDVDVDETVDNFDDNNVITFERQPKSHKIIEQTESETSLTPAFQSLPLELPSLESTSPFSSLMTQSCIEPMIDSQSSMSSALKSIVLPAISNDTTSNQMPPPPASSPPPLEQPNTRLYSRSNSSSSAFVYSKPQPTTTAPATISIISPSLNNISFSANRIQNSSNEKTPGGVRMINSLYNGTESSLFTGKPTINGTEPANQRGYQGGFTEKLYRTRSQPTLLEQLNSIDQRLKNRRNKICNASNDNDNVGSESSSSRANSASKLRTQNCSGQSQALANNTLAKSSAALSVAPANSLDQV